MERINDVMVTITQPITSVRGLRTFDAGISYRQAERQLSVFYAAQVLASQNICEPLSMDKIASVARWMTGQGKPSLMLYGSYGLGKTTMLNAVRYVMRLFSKVYVSPIYEAKYLSERGTDDIKRTFGLLIIDELGRESDERKDYGNITEPLTDLLYYRDKIAAPTLIATNCTLDELKDKYGSFLFDRISAGFNKIYYEGGSYRK